VKEKGEKRTYLASEGHRRERAIEIMKFFSPPLGVGPEIKGGREGEKGGEGEILALDSFPFSVSTEKKKRGGG